MKKIFLFIVIFFCLYITSYAQACEDFDIECISGTLIDQPYQSVISEVPVVISWPLEKAYPDVEYNIRLAVVGGVYPYNFSLVQAPGGMQIDGQTGEISWTPSSNLEGQSFNVEVEVRDELGGIASQLFSLQVTKEGFYFISSTGDDSLGNGSISNPWKTVDFAIKQGSLNDILYLRGGDYAGKIDIESGNMNKWIAYPGERPVLDMQLTVISPRDNFGLVDGLEIKNSKRWSFSFNGQTNYIFRRNHMHHLYDSSDAGNPSFIFFWDGSKNHKNIVIQDNIFHDLFDRGSGINGDDTANYHGSSTVMYDVLDSLVENNTIYNIDGNGIHDKDNSLRNVHRGNLIYDIHDAGIAVSNQYYSYNVEVSYNRLENQLRIGGQPQYIGNISVHHNTIIGFINHNSGTPVGSQNSIQIHDNIIYDNDDSRYVYNCCNSEDGGLYGSNLIFRNYNIIHTLDDYIAGLPWGGDQRFTTAEWQTKGFEVNSLFTDPLFSDLSKMNLTPVDQSLACGNAHNGSDIGAMSCVSDLVKPVLTQLNHIQEVYKKNGPSFVFNSSESGAIAYSGLCLSSITSVIAGENTITFNELSSGATYSSCSITVTDTNGNSSTPLQIPEFTITYPSDNDLDKDVDIFDYNILLTEFGKTSDCQNQADTNEDCQIDIFDYNSLLGDFGKSI